jgi:serine/threonine-protein kinase HipA
MLFNVIARNVDDHSKNVSFCMNPEGVWRLSPAYDLTYSVDMTAPAYANRHSLTVNGKNEGITRKDMESAGVNNNIQDCKTLIETVLNAVAKFETYAQALGIDAQLIESIQARFNDKER